MSEEKKRRPRRTKADIINSINKAAEELIKKDGFSNSFVTDIIKLAKIEPAVFYNRYNNIESFFDEYVKNYDYWFSNILKKLQNSTISKDGLYEILQQLFTELNNDSVMLELLRWEIASDNSTTQRTAMLREVHILPLVKEYEKYFKEYNIDIAALTALTIGGIYYLSLHKDRSFFSGIDINTQNGMDRILNAVKYFTEKFFEEDKIKYNNTVIAQRLKDAGISEDIIQQCVWNKE